MALFKIFNNFASGNTSLPETYVEGYCYFDKNTGKFYVDTTSTAAGRMAMNAKMADEDSSGRNIVNTYVAPSNTPTAGQVLFFNNGAPTWMDLTNALPIYNGEIETTTPEEGT